MLDDRLPAPFGRLIDRSRPLSFRFEGQAYGGFDGDVLASALAASGAWVLSRSFKYHRPRGIATMGGREANTLVQAGGHPNILADRLPLREGLVAGGQNVSGSLARDRLSLLGLLSPLLPVGFYYQTFYKPRWMFWEPMIRKFAGLGSVDPYAAAPPVEAPEFVSADVAIVGGGCSGMKAALAEAGRGADVVLIDENAQLGGRTLFDHDPDGSGRTSEARALEAAIRGSGVQVIAPAVATGLFADNWLTALSAERLFRIRAERIVLATGSSEQMAVFRNNDLPGVMLGSAARRLMMLYGVRPGHRAVILTATADGYRTALMLHAAGVAVEALVDLRPAEPDAELAGALRDAGVEVLASHGPIEAHGTSGNRHVRALSVAPLLPAGTPDPRRRHRIECDLVAVSVGEMPTFALAAQASGGVEYSAATGRLGMRRGAGRLELAGRAAELTGASSGAGAVARDRHTRAWIFPHAKGRDFVDMDEDIQVGDLLDSVAQGYDTIELTKRYSTVGMGPSQGKHSALASLTVVADATGRACEPVRFTTSRPPFMPEAMGVIAGHEEEPRRLTPMHRRHLEAGAQMVSASHWLRPTHYGPAGERVACVENEATHVRNAVGIVDVSTLGKIEVRGPDAAAFLECIYTGRFANLREGQIRYALMTDEAGVVMDDGVAARLGPSHFFVTSTTSAIAAVFRSMKWWNAQWRLRVDLTNVTSGFAAVNLAGPRSRDVLARLCAADVDLRTERFPYMEARTGAVAGIDARIMRLGYVGELGFEIHVPSSRGEYLWDRLVEAGKPDGLRPFGTDAQRLLRLEKGHFIVGRDSDGMTHPAEIGLRALVARQKPFFVGKRSIEMRERIGPKRALIGFTMEADRQNQPAEGALVLGPDRILGRVTSVAYSPSLRTVIGLALVADPHLIDGEFDIKGAGIVRRATRAPFPFYDPRHERQKA